MAGFFKDVIRLRKAISAYCNERVSFRSDVFLVDTGKDSPQPSFAQGKVETLRKQFIEFVAELSQRDETVKQDLKNFLLKEQRSGVDEWLNQHLPIPQKGATDYDESRRLHNEIGILLKAVCSMEDERRKLLDYAKTKSEHIQGDLTEHAALEYWESMQELLKIASARAPQVKAAGADFSRAYDEAGSKIREERGKLKASLLHHLSDDAGFPEVSEETQAKEPLEKFAGHLFERQDDGRVVPRPEFGVLASSRGALSTEDKKMLYLVITICTGVVPGLIVGAVMAAVSHAKTGSWDFFKPESERLVSSVEAHVPSAPKLGGEGKPD